MTSKARIIVIALLLVGTLAALSSMAPAQGVNVITGRVTVNGAPAPAMTVVQVSLEDGTLLGSGATGAGGLDDDQYRIDVQVTGSVSV